MFGFKGVFRGAGDCRPVLARMPGLDCDSDLRERFCFCLFDECQISDFAGVDLVQALVPSPPSKSPTSVFCPCHHEKLFWACEAIAETLLSDDSSSNFKGINNYKNVRSSGCLPTNHNHNYL